MLFGDAGRSAMNGGTRNPNLVSVRLKRANRRSATPFRNDQNSNSTSTEEDKEPEGSQGRLSFLNTPLSWRQSVNIKELLLERGSIDLSLPDAEEEERSIAGNNDKFIGETVQETIALNSKWMQRTARFFVFYAVGIGFFMKVENWNLKDAAWFVAQTISTVGYGNIAPKTTSGRMFDIFYMLIGILLTFSVLGDITHNIVKRMRRSYSLPPRLNKLQLIVRHVLNLIMWIFIMFGVFLFGAVFFAVNEGWKFSDALYFSVVTCASVGYGDLVPQKTSSIWFNLFFILAGVSTTALAFEKVASFKRHLDCAELDQIVNEIELSPELLNAIDRSGRQRVSRAEYVLHMLQLAGRLGAADITPWVKRFEEYDADRDGYLTRSDWLEFQSRRFSKRDEPVFVKKGKNEGLASKHSSVGSNATMSSINTNNSSRPGSGSTVARKRSLIMQVADETRDVILETLKIKKTDSRPSQVIADTSNEVVVVSPMRSALVLKRASTISDQSHDSLRVTVDGVELANMDDSAPTNNDDHDEETGIITSIRPMPSIPAPTNSDRNAFDTSTSTHDET